MKTSVIIDYYSNGNPRELTTTDDNGQFQGIYKFWYHKSSHEKAQYLWYECFFENNLIDGEYIQYD